MKGVLMLVLARNAGERVCIGASVVATEVSVHNGQARLAFDAPADVAIDREEVRRGYGRSAPEDGEHPALLP
jgi:carbon storage regulator CsrA